MWNNGNKGMETPLFIIFIAFKGGIQNDLLISRISSSSMFKDDSLFYDYFYHDVVIRSLSYDFDDIEICQW